MGLGSIQSSVPPEFRPEQNQNREQLEAAKEHRCTQDPFCRVWQTGIIASGTDNITKAGADITDSGRRGRQCCHEIEADCGEDDGEEANGCHINREECHDRKRHIVRQDCWFLGIRLLQLCKFVNL